jgi:hypothetical protein
MHRQRMNDISIRLYDLEEKVNKIWKSPVQWRYIKKNIEFGLLTSDGISWFPYYRAPEKVEKCVNSYIKINLE